MRQIHYIAFLVVTTIGWLAFLNYYLIRSSDEEIERKKQDAILVDLENSVIGYKADREKLLMDISAVIRNVSLKATSEGEPFRREFLQLADASVRYSADTIAVVVIACDRITVSRCLDQLIRYRPSPERFPIIVSQDCVNEKTSNAIDKYGSIVYHLHQPDQREIIVPPKEKKFRGYFKIARHYRWALNETFNHYNFSNAIVIEDDLDISPDFFEYFQATLPVLQQDTSLWCVSAWNDNGKPEFVDKNAVDLLYRSHFFPGLGWMLTASLWNELYPKWPKSYWDDWMREPAQRKGRSCIRPEISRTKTFGKIGVSNGLFYDKHLRYIHLNDKFMNFTSKDLGYLKRETYDMHFSNIVYSSPIVSFQELKQNQVVLRGPVRILYDNKEMLKRICKSIGLMDDLKSGVPRTAYMGIISFMYKNRRVFLTPSTPFEGYEN